ncbi:MAG: hypothetical protein AAF533_07520 [Acidobacteriota bacterium]
MSIQKLIDDRIAAASTRSEPTPRDRVLVALELTLVFFGVTVMALSIPFGEWSVGLACGLPSFLAAFVVGHFRHVAVLGDHDEWAFWAAVAVVLTGLHLLPLDHRQLAVILGASMVVAVLGAIPAVLIPGREDGSSVAASRRPWTELSRSERRLVFGLHVGAFIGPLGWLWPFDSEPLVNAVLVFSALFFATVSRRFWPALPGPRLSLAAVTSLIPSVLVMIWVGASISVFSGSTADDLLPRLLAVLMGAVAAAGFALFFEHLQLLVRRA